MKTGSITLTTLSLLVVCGLAFAAESAPEGDLQSFLG
jgi:hypothetical protein